MPTVRVDDIDLCYESFGHEAAPPLLLIAGLGAHLTWWSPGFVTELVERGFRVIRYDNRDAGLSTKTEGPPPTADDLQAIIDGTAAPAYTLSDLADDAVGLLDRLSLRAAHVVGASMGAMIAQTVAIEHPERVLSLTSIMSTTGDRSVGGGDPAVTELFLSEVPPIREVAIEMAIAGSGAISGSRWDPEEARARATEKYDRCFHPGGVAFQLAAINGSPDRTPGLQALDRPTLVIHGREDRLVALSGGLATAEAIPGADLLVLSRMGHDLPSAYWPQIADAIVGVARATSEAAVHTH